VKRDHSDKKNERILRVSYHLVLCHWLSHGLLRSPWLNYLESVRG